MSAIVSGEVDLRLSTDERASLVAGQYDMGFEDTSEGKGKHVNEENENSASN